MDSLRRRGDPPLEKQRTDEAKRPRLSNPFTSLWKGFRRLRPRARVIVVLLLVGSVYLYVGGDDGFYVQWRFSRQIARYERENAALAGRNAEMREQVARLQSDTTYIERIARERYGMARPGERVYRIVPPAEGGKGDAR